AVRLPEDLAPRLRTGTPAVLARVHDGAALIDLRCVPDTADAVLTAAVCAALSEG
ncbi:L-seryl-tRNA(Sec) selenium transferase, partial [Gordonia hirsuta DSM 44140 = NBRC 16056]